MARSLITHPCAQQVRVRLAGNVGNIPIPIDCTLRGLTQYSRTNNAEVVQSVETHHRPANFDALT